MVTLVDLIRRSGREPGGGFPKGYVEMWTFSLDIGAGTYKQLKHGWEPYKQIDMTKDFAFKKAREKLDGSGWGPGIEGGTA